MRDSTSRTCGGVEPCAQVRSPLALLFPLHQHLFARRQEDDRVRSERPARRHAARRVHSIETIAESDLREEEKRTSQRHPEGYLGFLTAPGGDHTDQESARMKARSRSGMASCAQKGSSVPSASPKRSVSQVSAARTRTTLVKSACTIIAVCCSVPVLWTRKSAEEHTADNGLVET